MTRHISPALSNYLRQLIPGIKTAELRLDDTLEITCSNLSPLPATVEFEGTTYKVINMNNTEPFTPKPSAFWS